MDCPELSSKPKTRAHIALTSETETTLDVRQHYAAGTTTTNDSPCSSLRESSVNMAAEGKMIKKTENQKKRNRDKKKKKKKKKRQRDMAVSVQKPGLTEHSTTALETCSKRQRIILDDSLQLPHGESKEEVFFLRAKQSTSESSAVCVTLERGSVSVLYTRDLEAGLVLGSMSGVVSGTPRPDHPSVALDSGGHLLLCTSNKGILALAAYAADGSANAEVNRQANVVTNRHVLKGEKVVIMLPPVVSDAVADSDSSLLHAVANRSLFKRMDEDDELMRFPSLSDVDLDHLTHRCFASPFKTATYGCCVRIKNKGTSATELCVNGIKMVVPALHGLLAPADAYYQCSEGSNVSAAVLCAKVSSPAQALEISEEDELPEALPSLRNICSLSTSKSRRDYEVPFIIREIPESGVVQVRRSDISESDGVFATDDVSPGTHLTCYSGTVLHLNQWSKIPFVHKEYAAGVPDHRSFVCDARVNFDRGLGRFLNQSIRGTANCVLEWVKVPNRPGDTYPCGYISVKATKNIKKDEEIFMSYGAGHVWNTAKKVREPSAELEAAEKCPAAIVPEEDTEDTAEYSL